MAIANSSYDYDDDFRISPPISPDESRRTYSVTYSRADMIRFPDCDSFAKCVLEAFEHGKNTARVVQWTACLENNSNKEHKHYHMAITLSGTRLWYGVSKYLKDKHNIIVNFSSKHCGYIAAYRYVCKDKTTQDVLHSPNRVNLVKLGSPRTKNAIKQFSTNAEKRRFTVAKKASDSETQVKKAKVTKPERLSNTDVSEFLLKHNIKTELMVIAKRRPDDCEKDIYNFIVNKTQKALSELVSTTWKIQNAPAIVECNSKSRIEILNEYVNTACVENCNGEWFLCVRKVLKNNSINLYVYAKVIGQCLKNGCQKQIISCW